MRSMCTATTSRARWARANPPPSSSPPTCPASMRSSWNRPGASCSSWRFADHGDGGCPRAGRPRRSAGAAVDGPVWGGRRAGGVLCGLDHLLEPAPARRPGSGDGQPLPDWLQRFVDARATRIGLRALGLVLAVVTVGVAALGPNNSAINPAPTWVYVWFWVGLVPASLLLGPIWRLLNPLRTLSAGLVRLSGDPDEAGTRSLPARLGYWPAAIGLAVFAWLELVYLYGTSRSPCWCSSWSTGRSRSSLGSPTGNAGSPGATASRSTPAWSPGCARSAAAPTAASPCATRWPTWPAYSPNPGWWRW